MWEFRGWVQPLGWVGGGAEDGHGRAGWGWWGNDSLFGAGRDSEVWGNGRALRPG